MNKYHPSAPARIGQQGKYRSQLGVREAAIAPGSLLSWRAPKYSHLISRSQAEPTTTGVPSERQVDELRRPREQRFVRSRGKFIEQSGFPPAA